MTLSGRKHPRTDAGRLLDATFELNTTPVVEIICHYKTGRQDSARSRNTDYHAGLELLLMRLAELRLTILEISVASGPARRLDPADRRLAITFPIDLHPGMDVRNLRLNITRAQKSVAQRPDAKPGGGNDQKTIRILLTGDHPSLTYETLLEVLRDGRRK